MQPINRRQFALIVILFLLFCFLLFRLAHNKQPQTGLIIHPTAKTSPVEKPQASITPGVPVNSPTTAVDYTSKAVVYGSPVPKSVPIDTHPSPSTNSDQGSPAPTTSSNDKYDGDCTGHETVGRCADKCPPPSFERGFDKETGAAICGTVTGCPYGDSVPLGDQCYKNCLNTNPQAATDVTICIT